MAASFLFFAERYCIINSPGDSVSGRASSAYRFYARAVLCLNGIYLLSVFLLVYWSSCWPSPCACFGRFACLVASVLLACFLRAARCLCTFACGLSFFRVLRFACSLSFFSPPWQVRLERESPGRRCPRGHRPPGDCWSRHQCKFWWQFRTE